MPDAESIRVTGAYQMRDSSIGPSGDGVLRINGEELLRLPAGPRPFAKHDLDIDVSSFRGKDVMFEFVSDGPHRTASADWFEPRFDIEAEGKKLGE
jgi:hypothetical protein